MRPNLTKSLLKLGYKDNASGTSESCPPAGCSSYGQAAFSKGRDELSRRSTWHQGHPCRWGLSMIWWPGFRNAIVHDAEAAG